jgi:hypothetical protein
VKVSTTTYHPSIPVDSDTFTFTLRADMLRKLLLYWHQVTRTSIHRRERLRRREEEMRQAIIAAAWERWRDRFLEESLRGVVCLRGRCSQPTLFLTVCGAPNVGA